MEKVKKRTTDGWREVDAAKVAGGLAVTRSGEIGWNVIHLSSGRNIFDPEPPSVAIAIACMDELLSAPWPDWTQPLQNLRGRQQDRLRAVVAAAKAAVVARAERAASEARG